MKKNSEILNEIINALDDLVKFIKESAQKNWSLAAVVSNLENIDQYLRTKTNKDDDDYILYINFFRASISLRKKFEGVKHVTEDEFFKIIEYIKKEVVSVADRLNYEVSGSGAATVPYSVPEYGAEVAGVDPAPALSAQHSALSTQHSTAQSAPPEASEYTKIDALMQLEEIKEKLQILENILKVL